MHLVDVWVNGRERYHLRPEHYETKRHGKGNPTNETRYTKENIKQFI